MASNRQAGTINFQIDGVLYSARGSFSYMGSTVKREGIVGQDLIPVGYKETGLVPYIEGELNAIQGLNTQNLATIDGATITLELANGTVFTLMNAWCDGELIVETEDGKLKAKFEGLTSLEA